MTTLNQIRKADAAYRTALQRAEERRDHRDTLIRKAIAEGVRRAQIVEVTSLTRGRLSQIVLRKR